MNNDEKLSGEVYNSVEDADRASRSHTDPYTGWTIYDTINNVNMTYGGQGFANIPNPFANPFTPPQAWQAQSGLFNCPGYEQYAQQKMTQECFNDCCCAYEPQYGRKR